MKWSVDSLKQIQEGNSYIVMNGTVSYQDAFGAHWTHFCAYTSGPNIEVTAIKNFKGVANCIAYNAIDE
jgi:hypothetical protein